jgi:hypothetical protein
LADDLEKVADRMQHYLEKTVARLDQPPEPVAGNALSGHACASLRPLQKNDFSGKFFAMEES